MIWKMDDIANSRFFFARSSPVWRIGFAMDPDALYVWGWNFGEFQRGKGRVLFYVVICV